MKKIYFAAVAGNLGMLSIGQFLGWPSPSLPKLMEDNNVKHSIHLTADEASWVASLLMLGAIAGAITCGLMVNFIGRKNTMLFTAVPSIISWLIIAFATSPWELYIARFMSGISTGIGFSVMPIYLGEISPANIRGNLTSMIGMASKFGTLIAYVVAPFISVQNFALISLTSPCLFVIIFIWVPESPYYFLRRNDKQKAINSFVQLRGKENIHEEIENIERSVKTDLTNKSDFRELLFASRNRRALMILLGLNGVVQMSGAQAVIQYAQIILDQAHTNLEGKYLTMILGAIQVIFGTISMFLSDRIGRKPLLVISTIGAAFSTAIVATYFNLQYNYINTSNWLPTIGITIYVIMYCSGLAPVTLTITSELFSINVKALGSTIVTIILNLWAFIVSKLYLIIANKYGTHVPFWTFTACSLAGTLFVLSYVPETKNKTLEQIQMDQK
ncbi:facilitated trehalose transporter Tret1 [Camponotus floridanus]|uniref:facilitated trehalose transporter Tret1 n=1 Tax=Camponotus floridanus TaxID=104421 RepID=UPI000971713C|nr:facilitated trehalose transporter Tret1 [Camponotus floridanus]